MLNYHRYGSRRGLDSEALWSQCDHVWLHLRSGVRATWARRVLTLLSLACSILKVQKAPGRSLLVCLAPCVLTN